MNNPWNRCSVCGRFIAYSEFVDGTARNDLVTPESAYTRETFDVYHVRCDEQERTENGGDGEA